MITSAIGYVGARRIPLLLERGHDVAASAETILRPVSRVSERVPASWEAATRVGVVTIRQMRAALLWAIAYLPVQARRIDVPEVSGLGQGKT